MLSEEPETEKQEWEGWGGTGCLYRQNTSCSWSTALACLCFVVNCRPTGVVKLSCLANTQSSASNHENFLHVHQVFACLNSSTLQVCLRLGGFLHSSIPLRRSGELPVLLPCWCSAFNEVRALKGPCRLGGEGAESRSGFREVWASEEGSCLPQTASRGCHRAGRELGRMRAQKMRALRTRGVYEARTGVPDDSADLQCWCAVKCTLDTIRCRASSRRERQEHTKKMGKRRPSTRRRGEVGRARSDFEIGFYVRALLLRARPNCAKFPSPLKTSLVRMARRMRAAFACRDA